LIKVNYGEEFLTILKLNIRFINNKTNKEHDNKRNARVYYTTYGFRNFKKGNSRFINNLKANRNLLQQANDTAEGQHPFAVVLSCIDSRASAELILTKGWRYI
jgi:hypothetical protein